MYLKIMKLMAIAGCVALSAMLSVVESQGLNLVVEPNLNGPHVCGSVCCEGWLLETSTGLCTIPVCYFQCLNGGRCVGPNQCYCLTGYYGYACQLLLATQQPAIITTEPLLARHHLRGPCFRVVTNNECKAPLSNMLTLHDDCCTTVGKAWGDPCYICPQQIDREKDCPTGFKKHFNTEECMDVNECEALDGICGNGACKNSYGSYQCVCHPGYSLDSSSTLCVASVSAQCYRKQLRGMCSDPVPIAMTKMQCCCSIGRGWGSQCESCPRKKTDEFRGLCPYGEGYQITPGLEGQKKEINECNSIPGLCRNGRCVNTLGSFRCLCDDGYKQNRQGNRCVDKDECSEDMSLCFNGMCTNTKGSYKCTCPEGFQLADDGTDCMDIDECSGGYVCNGRKCLNTIGSYHCMEVHCGDGYELTTSGNSCQDIDECEDDSVCDNGECFNSDGGYNCLCYQGYMPASDGRKCLDIDECEIDDSVCGEAECVNDDGTFHCECLGYGMEYHQSTKSCKDESKKDCYNNLNSLRFCENLIGLNMTKEECCCSLGEGWGDNCNLWPCPYFGTSAFNKMCPGGKGKLMLGSEAEGHRLDDIDECDLFHNLCPNGDCVNTVNGYECTCPPGYRLNLRTQQCVDKNECFELGICPNGKCVNTEGSYHCECNPPLTVDGTGTRCIVAMAAVDTVDTNATDVCWTELSNEVVCNSAMDGPESTYTDCCCTAGVGWGFECRRCPTPNSMEYNELCSEYKSRSGLRARPSQIRTPVAAARSDGQEELELDCGFLDGCVNGRCVRVHGGYACDCYRGFKLDRTGTTCRDINECRLLGNTLCWQSNCVNTPGSFKCTCYPGYVEITRNFCVKRRHP